jgi:molybdopterin converting factor small subunit
MSLLRLPTPLRPYADGRKEVEVNGATVADALADLARSYPELCRHLYDDGGRLRPYVNVFLNDDDVRTRQGELTPITDGDRLVIIPSIAGGRDNGAADRTLRPVDHTALRVNQAFIISFLGAAFIAGSGALVALVCLAMGIGAIIGRPGFLPLYRLLRGHGPFKPDVVQDNPEPHRFAQAMGATVLVGSVICALAGLGVAEWILAWAVIALAALNLFGGFCVGCAIYYWLHRLGAPGFNQAPPPGVTPGRRPSTPA